VRWSAGAIRARGVSKTFSLNASLSLSAARSCAAAGPRRRGRGAGGARAGRLGRDELELVLFDVVLDKAVERLSPGGTCELICDLWALTGLARPLTCSPTRRWIALSRLKPFSYGTCGAPRMT